MTTPAYYDADGVTVTAGRVKRGPWTIPLPAGSTVGVRACSRPVGASVSATPAGRAVELMLHTAFGLGCLLTAAGCVIGQVAVPYPGLWAVGGAAVGGLVLYFSWAPAPAWVVEVTTPRGTDEVRTCRTPADAEMLRASIERAGAAPAQG